MPARPSFDNGFDDYVKTEELDSVENICLLNDSVQYCQFLYYLSYVRFSLTVYLLLLTKTCNLFQVYTQRFALPLYEQNMRAQKVLLRESWQVERFDAEFMKKLSKFQYGPKTYIEKRKFSFYLY